MTRFFFAATIAVLAAAPAWAHTEASHFKGALTDDAPRLRYAAYFDEDGSSAETPVEQMTREQLQAEYQRLDRERPGLGGAIALTAIGGGLLLGGLVFLYVAVVDFVLLATVTNSYALVGYVFLGLAAALGITGGVLLAVGLVKLFQRIGQRRAVTQRMEDINVRLESMDRTGTPPPPPDMTTPPPPPPPPPGAAFFDVRPTLVMATF